MGVLMDKAMSGKFENNGISYLSPKSDVSPKNS